jgi:hypothetical protein
MVKRNRKRNIVFSDQHPVKVRPRLQLTEKEQKVQDGPWNGRKSTRYNILTFLPMTILY